MSYLFKIITGAGWWTGGLSDVELGLLLGNVGVVGSVCDVLEVSSVVL